MGTRKSRRYCGFGGEVEMIRQFCLVMKSRGSERRLFGKKNYSLERKVSWC